MDQRGHGAHTATHDILDEVFLFHAREGKPNSLNGIRAVDRRPYLRDDHIVHRDSIVFERRAASLGA